MITCGMCQGENIDGSQYCDECGASLSQTPPPRNGLIHSVSDKAEDGDAQVMSVNSSNSQPASQSARVAEVAVHPLLSKISSAQGAHPFARPSMTASDNTHAKLVILRGQSSGKEFFINENEALIGRWDADGGIFPDIDLDTDDPEAKVSRRHARIVRRGEQYFIEDLGSTNGTFVNRGRRLLPGDLQPLRDADEIIVGKTFLRLYLTK